MIRGTKPAGRDRGASGGRRRDPRTSTLLLVDHAQEMGGAQIALLHMLPALQTKWRLMAMLPADSDYAATLREQGVAVIIRPLPDETVNRRRDKRTSVSDAVSVLKLAAFIVRSSVQLRRARVDLVYVNSLKASVYGLPMALLAMKPSVFHVRDILSPQWLPSRTAWWVCRGMLRALPSAVIANSRTTASYLSRDAVVVRSPLGKAFLGPVDCGRPDGDGGLRFAVVGRLDPWKGQHVAIQAFVEAFGRDAEHSLSLVGGPLFGREDYEARLRAMIADMGLTESVRLVGQIDDVHAYMDGVDVLISATQGIEPLGQVIMQGQARGLCVIAPNVGGPAELIEHGHNGYLYEADNVHALSAAMRAVAGDSGLRRHIQKCARERAVSDYAHDPTQEVNEVLAGVLRRRAARRLVPSLARQVRR